MLKTNDLWAFKWDKKDVPIMVDESDGNVGPTVVLGVPWCFMSGL